MKINSLYISAFGGIKDLHLNLADGFNVIYGNNEDGKSTLMSFIKMMFYGSERGSSSIAKNIRKKYTPWDGSPMAGSIDFEYSGKKYRLEKEFRSSNSTDKTTLIDLSLGERQAVASDIGTKFFSLSLPAFERSVFIGQFGFPESDSAAVSELNSKLSNIALTGDESVSFEGVASRLRKARLNLMSKSGKAGVYDKNLIALKDAEEKLEKAENLNQTISNAKENAAHRAKEIEQLHRKTLALKEQASFEEDARKTEKLTEYLETKAQLDNLNENLKLKDGSLIDEMYLRSIKFCLSKYSTAENSVKEKQNQVGLIEESLNSGADFGEATPEAKERLEKEIRELENKQEENRKKAEALENTVRMLDLNSKKFSGFKKKGALLLIAGLLLIGAATALGIFNLIIPAAISGITGVIASAFGIVFLTNSSKLNKLLSETEKVKQKLAEINNNDLGKEIFDKHVKLKAVTTALEAGTSVIEKQKALLNESKAELEELFKSAENEKAELMKIAERYKPFTSLEELNEDIEEISQICAKQKEIKNNLNFIAKDLGNISYTEAAYKLEELKKRTPENQVDYESLKQELDNTLNTLSEKKSELSALLAEIKAAEKGAENPELIKTEINVLTQKTESQKEFCDACDMALEVLADSYAELRSGFGSALETAGAEIFSRLTNGKYDGMTVSDSFDIGVTEKGVFGNREVGFLSSGTADQTYLSLRLALTSLMNAQETLPILLDDALAQYDDGRLHTALEFLKEYSANTQIIMFTCHNHISTSAENLNATVKSIKE